MFATLLVIEPLRIFSDMLPTTMYSTRKTLDLEDKDFTQYAVCPKCHTLYNIDAVRKKDIQKCTYKRWPNHQQAAKRSECGTQLLNGSSANPKRVYCVRPVSAYLIDYVKTKNFVRDCNLWRCRTIPDDYLADIYDGSLWKSRTNDYLKNDHSLYGMINVDWVQPFTHTTYSLGVIYAIILNLPRSMRFKEENVMILGVIPGPTEPSLHINTYLKPLVDDLEKLNRGMRLQDGSRYGNIYYFRVLGCSSDLPATRKLGGFISYHAKQGKINTHHITTLLKYYQTVIAWVWSGLKKMFVRNFIALPLHTYIIISLGFRLRNKLIKCIYNS